MASPRFQIPREPASLKDAQACLVKACGGLERSSSLTRVSPTQLQRYTAPAEPDVHMPVDVALALEIATGEPHVSRFLALQTGNVLVSTLARDDTPLAQDLAAVGRDIALLFEQVGTAMADGTVSPAEAAEIEKRAMAGIAALASVMAETRRIRKDEGAA